MPKIYLSARWNSKSIKNKRFKKLPTLICLPGEKILKKSTNNLSARWNSSFHLQHQRCALPKSMISIKPKTIDQSIKSKQITNPKVRIQSSPEQSMKRSTKQSKQTKTSIKSITQKVRLQSSPEQSVKQTIGSRILCPTTCQVAFVIFLQVFFACSSFQPLLVSPLFSFVWSTKLIRLICLIKSYPLDNIQLIYPSCCFSSCPSFGPLSLLRHEVFLHRSRSPWWSQPSSRFESNLRFSWKFNFPDDLNLHILDLSPIWCHCTRSKCIHPSLLVPRASTTCQPRFVSFI